MKATSEWDEIIETPLKRLEFWAPRILCLLCAGLISLFALDVFGEGLGFWRTIPALFIRLVPTWILLLVLALSWRWERTDGILFNVLGATYLVMFWESVHWLAYLCLSGPLFPVGAPFLTNWLCRKELRTRT